MKTTLLVCRFSTDAKPFPVQASKTGNWYGPSNHASDGSPMFEPVPEYRDSNPKIDLHREPEQGCSSYLASTNKFRTIRDALQYYKTRTIKGHPVTRARIDKRGKQS